MRFSTGLTLAAALLGVDAACIGQSRRPSGHHFPSGQRSSSAVATAVPTALPTVPATSTIATTSLVATTSAVATTLSSVTTEAAEVTSYTTSSAPAATTSAASSSGLTDDQQNALDAQNSARSDVGSAALVWDDDLASEAQAWAEHLVTVGDLVHSEVSNEGENLYMGSGDSTPFVNAANMWIDEKSSYNGEALTTTNYLTFGHYTQIVWSSTTNVGMGLATGSDGAVYVVARYSPPGNYIGETAY
ncbi:putative CAP domain-containing protein [Seiridium cardinale]|uniref:CAP domain-containing protein n=1 Tax=Seiridium cardinale TaxID=138064 RepID=A0ABR2XFW5_9PEZI